MQGPTKAVQTYKAGDFAPCSGVYTVRHNGHRRDHLFTLFKGEGLPACAQCGEGGPFMLAEPGTRISEDDDFHTAAAPGAAKRQRHKICRRLSEQLKNVADCY